MSPPRGGNDANGRAGGVSGGGNEDSPLITTTTTTTTATTRSDEEGGGGYCYGTVTTNLLEMPNNQDKNKSLSKYGRISPTFNSIIKSSRTDFRGSMRELRSMIGEHTGKIGYLGSLAIACNSLTGPAMLHLPATFQRSGLIPTCCTLVFICILAAMCSLHMANTISKVPGNQDFKKEVEYAETFRSFWGNKSFVFAQILFFVCISCLNISSIVDTAQTVDTALGNYKGTAGLQISWAGYLSTESESESTTSTTTTTTTIPTFSWVHWQASECTEQMDIDGTCLPFFDDEKQSSVIFTMGYLFCIGIFLPMALMDLKENAFWQVIGFLVLLVVSLQFCIAFVYKGLDFSGLTLWGEDWSGLFGVILFNFALVVAVPAWLYEKEEYVDVPTVIHGSSCLTLILYVGVGALGTLAMPNVSENMLESMESGVLGLDLQIGASIFAFFIIGLGIPLFSVLTRYSLVGSGLLSPQMANIFAVYFPFGVGWLLYIGEGVTKLLSWGGVICTSLIAFILPLLVSLHTVEEYENEGSIDVYSTYFPSLKNKSAQVKALKILLLLCVLSIIAAIIGNIEGEL